MQPQILIIEDDAASLFALTEALATRLAQVKVDSAPSAEAAFPLIETCDYDVILSDVRLPGQNGLEVLRRARSLRPNAVVVLITAYGTEAAEPAMQLGASGFVEKPINLDQFIRVIAGAIQRANLLRRSTKSVAPIENTSHPASDDDF